MTGFIAAFAIGVMLGVFIHTLCAGGGDDDGR